MRKTPSCNAEGKVKPSGEAKQVMQGRRPCPMSEDAKTIQKKHLDIFLESKPRKAEEPAVTLQSSPLPPFARRFCKWFLVKGLLGPAKAEPHNQAKRVPTSPSKHRSWCGAGLEQGTGLSAAAAPRTQQAYGMGQHGGYLTLTRLEINYSVQVWPRLCM